MLSVTEPHLNNIVFWNALATGKIKLKEQGLIQTNSGLIPIPPKIQKSWRCNRFFFVYS